MIFIIVVVTCFVAGYIIGGIRAVELKLRGAKRTVSTQSQTTYTWAALTPRFTLLGEHSQGVWAG